MVFFQETRPPQRSMSCGASMCGCRCPGHLSFGERFHIWMFYEVHVLSMFNGVVGSFVCF